ncbi:hypothetical protein [Actinomadura sp. GC306]|uniref:hypothetical protein n=1 Tax=Actinomadura sp. GC306 TaxID=2530367 RepID=UPI001404B601|nr:hypothetical protein [Actinomadura sp. GC306]
MRAQTRCIRRRRAFVAALFLASGCVLSLVLHASADPRPAIRQVSAVSAAAPSDPEEDGSSDGDQGEEEGDDCGWVNVGCHTKEAITDWFRSLARDSLEPVLGFLADTQLATPEVGSPGMNAAEQIWATSRTIANTCFVLMVLLAGVMLMAGQTLSGVAAPGQTIVRLVVAFIAMNTSLIVIGYGIQLANGLARSIFMSGADRIDPDQAGRVFAQGIEASINTGGSFFVLVTLVVVVLACILAFIYVMRLAIIMVLVGVAPIALMFHALPLTDGLARLWWRGITGALAIQVCQSFVFITALQLLLSQHGEDGGSFLGAPTAQAELVDLLLVIALLYVLICIPRWVARTVWQPAQPRMLSQLVRTFVVYKGVGAVVGFAGKAARGTRGAARTAKASTAQGRPRPGGGGGPRNGPHGGPHGGPSGGNGPRPDRGPGYGPQCRQPRGPDRRHRPRPGSANGPRSGPHNAAHGRPGSHHRPGHGAAPRGAPHRPHVPPVPGRTGAGGPARPHPRIPTQPPTRPYRRAARPRRPAPRRFVRLDPPRNRRHGRRNR